MSKTTQKQLNMPLASVQYAQAAMKNIANGKRASATDKPVPVPQKHDIRPGQSVALLQELHILTRDGKLNQDSRRKLKQVYHLFNFIEPLLKSVQEKHADVTLVDHGAGKSYLGFILYDLFFKAQAPLGKIVGVETRDELVQRSTALAKQFGFTGMDFLNLSVAQSQNAAQLPTRIDIVTALHACNTATDDAIAFGIAHQAQHLVLVPCCQAEVAASLRTHKSTADKNNPLGELWRHPLHTREFASHATNVLRCLQLEAHGYSVTVTELVGWEHSMKNELIIATRNQHRSSTAQRSAERLQAMLAQMGLDEMRPRFFTPLLEASAS